MFVGSTECITTIVYAICVHIKMNVRGMEMKMIELLKLILIGYGFILIVPYLIDMILETIRLSLKEN